MQFQLTIKIDNDAFHEGGENPFGDSTHTEVARILHTLAERVEAMTSYDPTDRDRDDPFLLRDANGNSVGMAYFEEE